MALISPIRRGLILASALAAAAVVLCHVQAQEQQEPQLPQVSDQHKLLHKDVGTWDAVMKLYPQEGAEPIESKGTEKNELLAGGMWLISRFNGDIFGMPFTGVGTVGYDPVEKKYVGTWVDSISPHLTVMKGEYDAAKKTMTSTAEGRDFQTGEVTQSRHITRYIDDNTRTFEIHAKEGGEKERKVMEIQYKRRAE
ncbi:MAG TPA: DUF1579 domain-containing protein [Lacipirellulaceae bacterium]|jgi:hypothetical protein|nr:DUF1579 domain-containing protein [Lacipirellulaceae bacterium]